MPLTPRQIQAIQLAAGTLLNRMAGRARPQGVAALSEATDEAAIERARGRARSELEAWRRELIARRETLEREQGRRETELAGSLSELEAATEQDKSGREIDAIFQNFEVRARVEELRQALVGDRLNRELQALVRLLSRTEGNHIVYSLDPAIAPEVARLLGHAFVDGPNSWARVAADSLSTDLAIRLHRQAMGLEQDHTTPLLPDHSLPPELRLAAPEAEAGPGSRAWWREHSLPPMERRRPIQPLWREVLSTLRTQTFIVASLVGLVISQFQKDQDGSINRGLVILGSAVAILPIVVVETGRQRRERIELQREEVEKQLTAELRAWAEGRVSRAASRLKDELEWQVRVRGRAAFIQWWREGHAPRLPAAIERKKEQDAALRAKQEELRALQSEQRIQLESIDALRLLLHPRTGEDV